MGQNDHAGHLNKMQGDLVKRRDQAGRQKLLGHQRGISATCAGAPGLVRQKKNPSRKIIKTRKPLEQRIRNCQAQNARLEERIRSEVLEEDGFDPFRKPSSNERLSLYSSRGARWVEVGTFCASAGPGATLPAPGALATPLLVGSIRLNADVKYVERLAMKRRVAYEVASEASRGIPDPEEVYVVLLTLRVT